MFRWTCLALILSGCTSSGGSKSESQALATAAISSPNNIVGKPWRDFSPNKIPADLPLNIPGGRSLAIRQFQGVLTIVELIGGLDHGADEILAALDLRHHLKSGETVTNDCEIVGQPGSEGSVIGVVPNNVTGKTLQPRKAWKILSKKIRFEDMPASKASCTPEAYSY